MDGRTSVATLASVMVLVSCGAGVSNSPIGHEAGMPPTSEVDSAPASVRHDASLRPTAVEDAAPALDLAAAATDLAAPPTDLAAPPAEAEMPGCRRTIPVAGPGPLMTALAAAMPGDCLVVADGAYGDLAISAHGTAAAPVQVRALNKLKATAGALVVAKSAYVIVQGFAAGTLLIDDSDHVRITRCQFKGGPGPAWLRVDVQKGCMNGCTNTPPGKSDAARIDHCEIGPGTTSGDIMNPTALSTNARIDHNDFHDVRGAHVITVGCCGPMYDYHDTNHVIEQNLFTNVHGAELISIKSSASTFRYNTIHASGGDVDIRAGRHDLIYGNYIFGPSNAGIRMYEDDHRIFNNYVETGKALQMGPSNGGHAPIKNATVVFNTFLGSVSTSGTGNVITNNLVVGGNLGAGNLSGSAAELGLVRMGEAYAPGPGSKAIGAATGSFPFVTEDIAGRPRGPRPDMGAAQASMATALRRPLTAADVGPDAP